MVKGMRLAWQLVDGHHATGVTWLWCYDASWPQSSPLHAFGGRFLPLQPKDNVLAFISPHFFIYILRPRCADFGKRRSLWWTGGTGREVWESWPTAGRGLVTVCELLTRLPISSVSRLMDESRAHGATLLLWTWRVIKAEALWVVKRTVLGEPWKG